MMELIRMTFFRDWSRQQVIDFALAIVLTVASLTTTIFVVSILP